MTKKNKMKEEEKEIEQVEEKEKEPEVKLYDLVQEEPAKKPNLEREAFSTTPKPWCATCRFVNYYGETQVSCPFCGTIYIKRGMKPSCHKYSEKVE